MPLKITFKPESKRVSRRSDLAVDVCCIDRETGLVFLFLFSLRFFDKALKFTVWLCKVD